MRRKVYTKDQILKAAYEVVAKEGFKGFTARNIAKKMGIFYPTDLFRVQKYGRFKKYAIRCHLPTKLEEEVFPVEAYRR